MNQKKQGYQQNDQFCDLAVCSSEERFKGLKVCIVCSDGVLERGGVSHSLRRMMLMLSSLGVRFYIFEVAFHTSPTKTVDKLDLWTEEKHMLSVNAAISDDVDANNVMIAGQLTRYLRNTGCSLVHLFYVGRASHIASLVCRDLDLPYVASARGSDVERSRYFPLRVMVLKDVCQYATSVTCVTHRVAEILSRICPRSYTVFYNSILYDALDTEKTPNRSEIYRNKVKIVVDLREYYKKGGPVLLRALDELRGTNLTVTLLGPKPEVNIPRDQELVGNLESQGIIEFNNTLDHAGVRKVLKSCSAFIQASPTEGCPNMLIEAMAAGCPVIASRAGVAAEVLEHKKNAYLFDPWSVRDLTQGIAWLVKYPEQVALCASEAMEVCCEYFKPEHEKRHWLEVYSQALFPELSKHNDQSHSTG